MAKDYRKKQYILNTGGRDTLRWEGSEQNRPVPLVDCNIEPYVSYSVEKHKRWELMDEMINHMRTEPANPNHMILAVVRKPYSSNTYIKAKTNTTQDGAVVFGPRADVRSVLEQSQGELVGNQSKMSDAHHKIRQKHGQHRDHHRPGDRSKRLNFTEETVGQKELQQSKHVEISSFVLERKYMPKKTNYYKYTRRWNLGELVKDNRKWLKEYVDELTKNDINLMEDEKYGWPDSEQDEEVMVGYSDDRYSTEQTGTNLFLNNDGTLITGKFTVCISSLTGDPFTNDVADEGLSEIKQTQNTVDVQHSAYTFAVDLSPLLRSTLNTNPSECQCQPDEGCVDMVDYCHVAYLVLRESPKNTKQIGQLSDSKLFTVQLQTCLILNANLPVRNKPDEGRNRQSRNAVTLKALIQDAVQALKSLPVTCFDRNSCHPYEAYEIKDSQTNLAEPLAVDEDTISVLTISTTDDEEHSFLIVDHPERKPTKSCVVCNQPVTEKSIELCVNFHQACPKCLNILLQKKLNNICCGTTADEVCWKCPSAECSAPLLRLAQLQTLPLYRLAAVWKCADFLTFHGYTSVQRNPSDPLFYTNPDVVPGAVLIVGSDSRSSGVFPNGPIKVAFSPSTNLVSVIPKLYFSADVWGQMHSPASCDIARKFRTLQECLGDCSCTEATSKPAGDGMHPVNLPSPDKDRTEAYCNALSASWRQNFTRKVIHLDHLGEKRIEWMDESRNSPIPSEKTKNWLDTLGQIQSLVKYCFVMAHFEPNCGQYFEMGFELMQKEIYLGEALKIYPLTESDQSDMMKTMVTISPATVERFVNNAQQLNCRYFHEQDRTKEELTR